MKQFIKLILLDIRDNPRGAFWVLIGLILVISAIIDSIYRII